MEPELKQVFKAVGGLVTLTLLLVLGVTSCTTVDTGHRGVEVLFGEIRSTMPLSEGLYFLNPLSKVIHIDVRESKIEGVATTYTKDIQTSNIKFALNISVKQSELIRLYKELGVSFTEKIVPQLVEAAIKTVINKEFTAEELVSNREKARSEIVSLLTDSLDKRGFQLSGFELTNIDFNDAFEQAVEDKVIAAQRAKEAINKTAQIREEKEQTILKAQAEAESIKIRSVALEKNPKLIQYEFIQKWNGQLPKFMGGSNGMLLNFNMDNKE